MAHRTTTDIHPGGDVLLICGNAEKDNIRHLRVSSVFLGHTSQVFKAMLEPRSSEGNTLASSSCVEIPLPDDDPIAMEIICFVLHMRVEDLSTEIDAKTLIGIAKHCDKYNLVAVAQPAVNLWLDACLETSISYKTAVNLMEVAFMFKLWASVRKIGVIMVREADEDISDPDTAESHTPRIPFYIFDQLEKIREQKLKEMHTAVDTEIDETLHPKKPAGKCEGGCAGVNAFKLHLLKQLREVYIWPSNRADGYSLVEIRDHIEISRITNFRGLKKCHASCTAYTMMGARGIAYRIRNTMTEIINRTTFEVEFKPSEQNGMIRGFVSLV